MLFPARQHQQPAAVLSTSERTHFLVQRSGLSFIETRPDTKLQFIRDHENRLMPSCFHVLKVGCKKGLSWTGVCGWKLQPINMNYDQTHNLRTGFSEQLFQSTYFWIFHEFWTFRCWNVSRTFVDSTSSQSINPHHRTIIDFYAGECLSQRIDTK